MVENNTNNISRSPLRRPFSMVSYTNSVRTFAAFMTYPFSYAADTSLSFVSSLVRHPLFIPIIQTCWRKSTMDSRFIGARRVDPP